MEHLSMPYTGHFGPRHDRQLPRWRQLRQAFQDLVVCMDGRPDGVARVEHDAAFVGRLGDALRGVIDALASLHLEGAVQDYLNWESSGAGDADNWARALVQAAHDPAKLLCQQRAGLPDFFDNMQAAIRNFAEGLLEATRPSCSNESASLVAAGQGPTSRTTKSKRSTERGEGREKIIAALTAHHQYEGDGCLNQDPITNNELARKAGVANSTVSAFFKKEFKGYAQYRAICKKGASDLAAALKLLRGEYSPHLLFGRTPPGEGHDDE
jgi:hypothetical protein